MDRKTSNGYINKKERKKYEYISDERKKWNCKWKCNSDDEGKNKLRMWIYVNQKKQNNEDKVNGQNEKKNRSKGNQMSTDPLKSCHGEQSNHLCM